MLGITVPPSSVACGSTTLTHGSKMSASTWAYCGATLSLLVPCADGLKVTFPNPLNPAQSGVVGAIRRTRLIADIMNNLGHETQVSRNLIGIATIGESLE